MPIAWAVWGAGLALAVHQVGNPHLGIDRLPRPWLLRALGLVLTIAGAKLLFT